MPSLNAFNDFVISTGEKIIHSPDRIINDATKNTYTIARMLRGRGVEQTVQSGERLRAHIQLADKGTARYYRPNSDLDPQFADVLRKALLDWRFLADHYTYTQQELELNSGNPQTYYTNLLKSKRQAMVTSTYNVMEKQLWAAADTTQMEGQQGTLPYSVPAFVTTNTNGALPRTGPDAVAWTAVETINPNADTRWRNAQETYDAANPSTGDASIPHAFARMFYKLDFEAPLNDREYFESDNMSKMMICTNLDGQTRYDSITRQHNDRLLPPFQSDMGYMTGNTRYSGVQMKYCSELDTALGILDDVNAAIPVGRPVYFWLNLNYLYPIFHSRRYMVEEKPRDHVRQPFTKVVWTDTYYNLVCDSRRRQGVVFAA